MSTKTGIEWTEATWNPVSGCTRVSPGCDHCYAVDMTHRLEAMGKGEKYGGLTVLNNRGDRHFNGVVRCHEDALSIPLKRKKPTMYFVNSMSDLFHRDVPFEFIDRVFAVMALCPQHTFQILTKRPERMAEYLCRPDTVDCIQQQMDIQSDYICLTIGSEHPDSPRWPLPNVWLGTSCEDQSAADERIPHLLRCPAAVRFLSLEPLIRAIDLAKSNPHGKFCEPYAVDWVIAGCESLHKRAGRFADGYEAAARSLMHQCRDAGVAFFNKQMPINGRVSGDPSEWPEDLRVREMPKEGACV